MSICECVDHRQKEKWKRVKWVRREIKQINREQWSIVSWDKLKEANIINAENRIEKVKNDRNSNKIATCECFEKKEHDETSKKAHEFTKQEWKIWKMNRLTIERRVVDWMWIS